MPLGLLDLWFVTDTLVMQLTAAKNASTLWGEDGATTSANIQVTGLPPDAVRSQDGCSLCVYLFHVTPDKTYRNTSPLGGRALPIPQQPLALTLYYLVTASSQGTFIDEQRVMSIALKWFHEHPFLSAGAGADEVCLTIEPQTIDEIGRLWQAVAVPMRLSMIYRVSVVFIEAPPPPIAAQAVTAVVLDSRKPVPGMVVVDGTLTAARRLLIAGAGFDDTTVVELDGVALPITTARIPPPGQFRVIDQKTIDVQLPLSAAPGTHELDVTPAVGAPLHLTVDVT